MIWSEKSGTSRDHALALPPSSQEAPSRKSLGMTLERRPGGRALSSPVVSHLPRGRFADAEEAARTVDQEDDEGSVERDVPRLDRQIGGPEGLEQSDRETAEERARHR